MKSRDLFFIAIIIASVFITGCTTKTIDTGAFSIKVPKDWVLKPIKSIDSYCGSIGSKEAELTFDYSGQGFASALLFTEEQYLQAIKILFGNCKECRLGYDEKNLNNDFIQTTTRVKRTSKPIRIVTIKSLTPIQRKNNPNTDYWMYLTDGKKTDSTAISIPKDIKSHHIIIDTVGKYIRKLIWPKIAGKGITGIYIEQINSNFNFCLEGKNLRLKDQTDALTAFKTIKFKE